MILLYDTISIDMATVKKLKTKLFQGSRLKCNEVRVLLKELGYVLARQKGSHEQWVKEGRTFTLASHEKDTPYYVVDAVRKLMEEVDEEKGS